ncbi:hypothetical protein KSC_004540 [Ktedonobacter sp. SOSP1-52]|uniref:hypothetical protein n=1 Tax=Ktedonobacter sp. SOSP1-52 TaxID=2778366 RepID=UPI0019150AA5|nr:hypothetical protein [Ktedonobacter sp. SOSP1-52]GHO61562.1 hypothetical protein KSC_004540 [Ktedonobacter sp. SOSP1-52]
MRMRGPARIAQSAVRGLPKSRAGVFSSLERGELLLAASPLVSYNTLFISIKIPYIKPGGVVTMDVPWGGLGEE